MIDPTDTLQDALRAAVEGDADQSAEALAWLEVVAPDVVESLRIARTDKVCARGDATMRGRVVGYRPAQADPVLGLLLAVVERARADAEYEPKGRHRSVTLAEQADARRFLAELQRDRT